MLMQVRKPERETSLRGTIRGFGLGHRRRSAFLCFVLLAIALRMQSSFLVSPQGHQRCWLWHERQRWSRNQKCLYSFPARLFLVLMRLTRLRDHRLIFSTFFFDSIAGVVRGEVGVALGLADEAARGIDHADGG